MDDTTSNNQGQYMGGFSFGGATPAGGTPTPPTPPTPPPAQQPVVQPMPVYSQPAPTYVQPAPSYPQTPVYPQAAQPMPAYTPPAPAYTPAPAPAPMAPQPPMGGGFGDDDQASAQPPFDPNYRFGDGMKNFTTSIVLPAHNLKFDEAYFLNLLAGSISLSRDEKKKIVESTPKLRQEQIDELIRIFEEERAKFVELSVKHGAQLKKLEDQHAADWRDLEMEVKASAQKDQEAAKADEIRKQLGL